MQAQTPVCDEVNDPLNQAKELRDCARDMEFAEDSRSSDHRWIDVVDNTVRPPLRRFNCEARIEPQVNSHRNDPEHLGDPSSGGGRILARVRIFDGCRRYLHGKDPEPGYGKFGGFPPGISYIWVDSYEQTDSEWGSARAIVIPKVASIALIVTDDIRVCQHDDFEDEAATARWIFKPQDAAAWWTCSRNGCCNLDP